MLRIGIDIGGTFTDFVIYDPEIGSLSTFKLVTDNKNPAATVMLGLDTVLSDQPAQIIHGSTVATNALLERKGAQISLITTQGFKDILQIGRQNRTNLYDLIQPPSFALVPPEFRLEVTERIDSHGDVITPLSINQIDTIAKYLNESKIKSVAISLLFSFLYPHHEQIIAEHLRNFGFSASVSSEILPEYREYERTSTTVVNAYVSPILEQYFTKLQSSIPNSKLQIMQSNGGMISLPEAMQNGARCILSGPAGGIVGAQEITQKSVELSDKFSQRQKLKIITFDMGGTSTDVSLIDGEPSLTTDAMVGGCPIHLPLLDIHTIGAGGGSIAYVDSGGTLRVGPQSAGSDPGPACYGKGELPTVTDANLVLGRLVPDFFLGGQMKLYPERAFDAFADLGSKLNFTPHQAAFGVIDVVNIQMEKALRVISVERGHDPREFSLFSFGGAGGLHACELARQLRIPKVIISKYASTLSAFGMLVSNVVKDYVKTIMVPGNIPLSQLDEHFEPIVEQGIREIKNQAIPEDKIETEKSLDVRYIGQSYELNIPYTTNFKEAFFESHKLTYGYSYLDKDIEIVNIRLRAIGKVPPIHLPEINNSVKQPQPPFSSISVEFKRGRIKIPLYKYDHLIPGFPIIGPALIVSSDTTIFINQLDVINIDQYQNLVIDINNND